MFDWKRRVPLRHLVLYNTDSSPRIVPDFRASPTITHNKARGTWRSHQYSNHTGREYPQVTTGFLVRTMCVGEDWTRRCTTVHHAFSVTSPSRGAASDEDPWFAQVCSLLVTRDRIWLFSCLEFHASDIRLSPRGELTRHVCGNSNS